MRIHRGDAPAIPEGEGEDAPIDERRPIGPAVVLGAARGLVAGALPGLTWAALELLLSRRQAEAFLDSTVVCASFCAAGFVLGASNAAAARRRGLVAERILLLLGGLATPLALAAPALAIPVVVERALPAIHLREGLSIAGAVLVLGAILGFALQRAGAPRGNATWNDDTRRILAIAGLTWLGVVLVSFAIASITALLTFRLDPYVGWLAISFASVLILMSSGFLVSACFGIAKPLTRTLGRVLEPGRCALDRQRAEAAHAELWKLTWASSRAAQRATTPEERRAALESGLDPARLAHDQSLREPGVARHRWRDLRAYLDLLLELGRLDEVPSLLRDLPERRAVEAELARIRGQPARAAELAREALAQQPTPSVRSQLLGALALAELDLGQVEAARATIGGSSSSLVWVPGLVRLRAASVEARLAQLAPTPVKAEPATPGPPPS